MKYVFDGPAAGAEYTWIVELASGPRSCRRHDVITAEEFAGASPETKRNVEGLVERGILAEHDDEAVDEPGVAPDEAPATTDEVPATEPGKE